MSHFQIINNSVVTKREMYRKSHYSHDYAAFPAAPAPAAHVLSLPGPSCSESEPSADSPSQSLLPVHGPPAPPVHCTLNTQHTHATVLKLQPQTKWNFAQRFCTMHKLKTLDEILYHYLSLIQISNLTNPNSSSPSMHLISSQLNPIMV